MWIDLCEELIVEILSRLPSKSLVRFRSVSKSLYGIISSPKFIRLHTLRSPNKLIIVHQLINYQRIPSTNLVYTIHSAGHLSYNNPYTEIPILEYPFLNYTIVGSCDGILCLYEYRNGINLWNPSIRRKATVPDRPSLTDSEGLWCPMGFGFDPLIHDYKILIITMSKAAAKKGAESSTFVYTMKTDTWREIASPTSAYTRMSSQCLFSGSLHWVMKLYLPDSRHDYVSYMSTFHLSSEVFSRIELPEPSWETTHVTTINARLAVISSKHDDTWIWVREECNNNSVASWSVAFKVNTHEFDEPLRVFQLTPNADLIINPFYSGIII